MKTCNIYIYRSHRRFVPCWILLILGCVLTHSSFALQPAGITRVSGFRASVVKINISPSTPKQLLGYSARLSKGIHDSIYHRIIALDDGANQFFLVSTEICLMSPSEYDHVARILHQKLGIDPKNFWWTVTHTHSAPEIGPPGLAEAFLGDRYKHPIDTEYTSFVEKTLIDGIAEARKRLEPARMGVGWGFSQANINRRAIDVDGKASLGLNPDGPVDRRIGLIRLDKKNGQPLALIVNYPIHGTVLGQENVQISGDVTGVVANYIEQQTGQTVLFINGAAGNLAPIYSVYPNPRAGHLNQFRVLLGDRIMEAYKKCSVTTDSVQLFAGATTLVTPRKPNLSWPAYLNGYASTMSDGTKMVKLPVRFLKINEDIAIWSTPLELFCEISNEVRDRSPFQYTFYFGYTNGWLGYLPTEKEWKHGGYEVEVVCPYTPAAGRELSEAVLSYLMGDLRTAAKTNKK